MKVAFYTLGCKVNSYETEIVINQFKNKGHQIVDFNEEANIYIINTCTVTNTSDLKSRKVIRQAIKRNKEAIVVVMGCYSQIKSEELKKIEGIDIIIGNKDKSVIVDYVEEYLTNNQKITKIYDLNKEPFENMEIADFTKKTRALVKIQDGCNNYCAYCIIPYTRGPIRSKDKDTILKEIKRLVSNGYIEIVLTGIHTGSYGKDLNNYNFRELLQDILTIKSLKRLRISSIEITEINDDIISLLNNHHVIADHLHIPLQSGSNKILKAMNRKYDINYYIHKIKQIRDVRPTMAITTDIIVGFPGETDNDFNETIKVINEIQFTSIHVFPYSKRDKTKAATMENQIDEKTKKQRVKQLIILSNQLQLAYMNRFINKTLDFIPETYKEGYLIGHSSNYLKIKIKGKIDNIGKLLTIEIIKINFPYCMGKIIKRENM